MWKIYAVVFLAFNCIMVMPSSATVKYVQGYVRSDGTYVSGHYRDTSNDGIKWNNANELGYND